MITRLKSKSIVLFAILGGVILGLAIVWFYRRSEPNLIDAASGMEATSFDRRPSFVGLKQMPDTSLRPFALTLHEGRLLVSYLSTDRIDEFSDKLDYRRTFRLVGGGDASITGLAIEGDRMYAVDFGSGELLIADYESGKLLHSFGYYPGRKNRMKLVSVTLAGGNVYATDVATKQILVISPSTVPGVRDEWELILHFPRSSAKDFQLQYPTCVAATPDGRLVVGDAGNKNVKAFTCNGRPAHDFEKEGEASLTAPMGIAIDNLPSPKLLAMADTVFNPSGVFDQGRIHVVDAVQARVKVFDALGSYVLSYGDELRQPNGIAIDQSRRLIFITDAWLRAIVVYKY